MCRQTLIIKSTAEDLLCIQKKQNNNYPIPKNNKICSNGNIHKKNQWIKEKNIKQWLKTELNSSNELSSLTTAPYMLLCLFVIFIYPSTRYLFLKFISSKFKGNETPENAPGRQAFKIKMEWSEYRIQGTCLLDKVLFRN